MGRVIAKCREGHVNEVGPKALRCPECDRLFVSKGWMPTALAADILAEHGKTLAETKSETYARQANEAAKAIAALPPFLRDTAIPPRRGA